MSGMRLLDAVALINASRAVASQHLSIRVKQLDVYSKTSTLAKALKRQRDTAAQTPLSSRLRSSSGGKTASSRRTYSSKSGSTAEKIPSAESVQGKNDINNGLEGLEQDHSYRSEDNSVADAVPNEESRVRQEKAKRYTLTDGTIPAGKAHAGKYKIDQDVYNQRPAPEPANSPLEQTGSPSASLEPESSRRSSIPDPDTEISKHSRLSPHDAKTLQRQSESQIPSKVAEPPRHEAYEVEGSTDDGSRERDTFYQAPRSTSPVLSALPRVKLPKKTGDVQGGDSHIKEKVNADVFYSSDTTGEGVATSEPSEEMVDQIFHSPRVARILGSKGQFGSLKPGNPSSLQRRSAVLGQGKDKDVTSNPNAGEFKPAPWAKGKESDIVKLAADIEKDAGAPPNVSKPPTLFPVLC